MTTIDLQTQHCTRCLDESYTEAPHTEGWEYRDGWLCQVCKLKEMNG